MQKVVSRGGGKSPLIIPRFLLTSFEMADLAGGLVASSSGRAEPRTYGAVSPSAEVAKCRSR